MSLPKVRIVATGGTGAPGSKSAKSGGTSPPAYDRVPTAAAIPFVQAPKSSAGPGSISADGEEDKSAATAKAAASSDGVPETSGNRNKPPPLVAKPKLKMGGLGHFAAPTDKSVLGFKQKSPIPKTKSNIAAPVFFYRGSSFGSSSMSKTRGSLLSSSVLQAPKMKDLFCVSKASDRDKSKSGKDKSLPELEHSLDDADASSSIPDVPDEEDYTPVSRAPPPKPSAPIPKPGSGSDAEQSSATAAAAASADSDSTREAAPAAKNPSKNVVVLDSAKGWKKFEAMPMTVDAKKLKAIKSQSELLAKPKADTETVVKMGQAFYKRFAKFPPRLRQPAVSGSGAKSVTVPPPAGRGVVVGPGATPVVVRPGTTSAGATPVDYRTATPGSNYVVRINMLCTAWERNS